MDPKPKPNRELSLQALRAMSDEQRLHKVFELSAFARSIFVQGLRQSFPDMPDDEFRQLVTRRLERCHNQNY